MDCLPCRQMEMNNRLSATKVHTEIFQVCRGKSKALITLPFTVQYLLVFIRYLHGSNEVSMKYLDCTYEVSTVYMVGYLRRYWYLRGTLAYHMNPWLFKKSTSVYLLSS